MEMKSLIHLFSEKSFEAVGFPAVALESGLYKNCDCFMELGATLDSKL